MDKTTEWLVRAANTEFEVGHPDLPDETYRTFERSGLNEDNDRHLSRLVTILIDGVRNVEHLTNRTVTRIYISIMNQSVSCEAFYKDNK